MGAPALASLCGLLAGQCFCLPDSSPAWQALWCPFLTTGGPEPPGMPHILHYSALHGVSLFGLALPQQE
jgi:hypothetical protein